MIRLIRRRTNTGTIHGKSTQLTLEIIPTSLGSASMTKVRSSTHLYVQLVKVVGFVVRGFGAEGTFFHDHVCVGDAEVSHGGMEGVGV